jgi:hypothetical protein
VKKSILLLVLACVTFTVIGAGCKASAKVDDDGAKAEIKGND